MPDEGLYEETEIVAFIQMLLKKMKDVISKGPAFLDGLVKKLDTKEPYEWKGKLSSSSAGMRFQIRYYGATQGKLIVRTDVLPQKLIAEDVQTKEQILIFDGGLHGYNAQFTYLDDEQNLSNRTTDQIYEYQGKQKFELILTAYYQIDYESEDEEFIDEVDKDGNIKLLSGKRVSFDEAKRNGFDYFGIIAIDNEGKQIEILSEELA